MQTLAQPVAADSAYAPSARTPTAESSVPVASTGEAADTESGTRFWNRVLAPYKRANDKVAWFQLITTGALFGLFWWLMLRSLSTGPYWVTLLWGVPAAFMSIRLFIFQHDCGHGSFFSKRKVNQRVGAVLGVLTFTPFSYWKRTHAIHHASSGNLDVREYGDVVTLTVREYLDRSKLGRFAYRLYRSMPIMLLLGPLYQFLIKHRMPYDVPASWKREWRSIIFNNLALTGILVLCWQTIGIGSYLKVQIPITLIAGTMGIWLFYVQHQFEDTYWEHEEEWNYQTAGLKGSSFYDLPAWLHYMTGNIGYHHIHHLSSLIPNYQLARCMHEVPELQQVTRLTLWQSFKTARLKLWDEDSRQLVSFRQMRKSSAATG